MSAGPGRLRELLAISFQVYVPTHTFFWSTCLNNSAWWRQRQAVGFEVVTASCDALTEHNAACHEWWWGRGCAGGVQMAIAGAGKVQEGRRMEKGQMVVKRAEKFGGAVSIAPARLPRLLKRSAMSPAFKFV